MLRFFLKLDDFFWFSVFDIDTYYLFFFFFSETQTLALFCSAELFVWFSLSIFSALFSFFSSSFLFSFVLVFFICMVGWLDGWMDGNEPQGRRAQCSPSLAINVKLKKGGYDMTKDGRVLD